MSLYPTFPATFSIEEPLFVSIDALAVPLFLRSFQRRGTHQAHVQFEDFDSTQRVTELLGKELSIQKTSLPVKKPVSSKDEFTFEDLIGFEVKILDLNGHITDFYDNDANPLFEIELSSGETSLVPAVEDFIAGIDFHKRIIKFVLPEGLLEL